MTHYVFTWLDFIDEKLIIKNYTSLKVEKFINRLMKYEQSIPLVIKKLGNYDGLFEGKYLVF